MARQKGVTGGPPRSFKWGGINFTPTMDSEPEFELGENDYEVKRGGNGDIYSDATSIVPYFQCDVNLTEAEYQDAVALKDGNARSGAVTLANGTVLILNCTIDGEFRPTNGVATLKLSGVVTKQ
jgi:hypothetical protein